MAGDGRNQTVLVLGGGIGGVVTTNRLRKRLDPRHRVVLVNREAQLSFAASYLWVMTGTRHSGQVTRPLQRLQRRGIEVVIGEVERIDPRTCTVRVAVRSAEAAPMPVAGANVSAAVEQILAQRGIDYQPNRQITSAESGLIHFGNEAESTDLLVYMPPIAAPAVIADSALATDDGWIHADLRTLATGFEGVYSIGDNTQNQVTNLRTTQL